MKPTSNYWGTAWRADLRARYSDLVAVFGKPHYGPNDIHQDKTTCGWAFEFDDGTIATIYDYRTISTPMFEFDWSIGGHDERAVQLVMEKFNYHFDPVVTLFREYEEDK